MLLTVTSYSMQTSNTWLDKQQLLADGNKVYMGATLTKISCFRQGFEARPRRPGPAHFHFHAVNSHTLQRFATLCHGIIQITVHQLANRAICANATKPSLAAERICSIICKTSQHTLFSAH